MTDKIYNAAKHYKEKGYNVLPVSKTKQPLVNKWGVGIDIPLSKFKGAYGIGLVCDKLMAYDLDLKYLTDESPESFMSRIKEAIPKKLLEKFYIQKTMNGGYHFICRVEGYTEGNLKLAQRPTTSDEKYDSFIKAWEKHKDFDKAVKIGQNDKVRVLLETRSLNGYVLMPPSEGYTPIYGELNDFTVDEVNQVCDIMRTFNTYISPAKKVNRKEKLREGESDLLIEWYNDNGDVLGLLEDYGWEEVGRSGNSVRLKRPGGTDSKSSALYDESTRIFNVFSTSTSFSNEKGYNGWMVLYELLDGNYWDCIDYVKSLK